METREGETATAVKNEKKYVINFKNVEYDTSGIATVLTIAYWPPLFKSLLILFRIFTIIEVGRIQYALFIYEAGRQSKIIR